MTSLTTYDPYQLTVPVDEYIMPTTWWWRPFHFINQVCQEFYHRFILSAFARVYVHGPNIAGFGFWQGRSPEQVCASLTVSNEDFWRRNMDECHLIVSRHFASWVVLVEFMVYAVLLWKLYRLIVSWLHFWFEKPRARKHR